MCIRDRRDAGWNGIVALGVPAGATSLSFTDCTFEYGGATPAGTVYGDQTNGMNSEVNIAVSGCTFRDPKGCLLYTSSHGFTFYDFSPALCRGGARS